VEVGPNDNSHTSETAFSRGLCIRITLRATESVADGIEYSIGIGRGELIAALHI